MSAAADRAVYAIEFWGRRRDFGAAREVLAGLSDADRMEVAWLVATCRDLDGISDDELLARMRGLAVMRRRRSSEPRYRRSGFYRDTI